ncbi:hypothetical protein JCM11491_002060 [Sporobolomyces phaffii]
MSAHPTEAPPSYESASSHAGPQDVSHLAVPGRGRAYSTGSNTASSDEEGERGLSTEERVSMEDSFRDLPPGWTREFDPNSQHFFFVDTKASPPRSIWSHPLDDEAFIKSHPEYREASRLYAPPEGAPPSEKTNNPKPDHHRFSLHHSADGGGAAAAPSSSSSSSGKIKTKDDRTLGRKIKDKMTGQTHEQRVAQRKRQKEEELKQYQAYIMRRNELLKAQREGRYTTVYAAPATPFGRPMYGGGYGGGYGGMYGRPGYGGGYYGRPGYGYGGGMGGMGAGMGLLGGLAVGSLLF